MTITTPTPTENARNIILSELFTDPVVLTPINAHRLIFVNIVHAQCTLLTVVLTDVVLPVRPDVFVQSRTSVFSTNTRTPVVVCMVGKV